MNVIAIVNKMNDLEEEYTENVEKQGEIFIEGLQNKRSLGELEKEYSKKVKEIRKIYEKSLKKELEKEKKVQEKRGKNNKKIQEKEVKEFQVQNLELERNWKDEKQIEIASFGYKTNRKIKNFIKSITPNYIIYIYYKTKRILKDFFKNVKELIIRIWEKISGKILNFLLLIKRGALKIIYVLKEFWNFIKKKIKKENKEKIKEDKGERKENASKD